MSLLAVIAGSGFTQLPGLKITQRQSLNTPFGEPSAAILHGQLRGQPMLLLPRHGEQHQFPPHKINYRANLWALQALGVTEVIAIAAVGGIHPDFQPGVLALPDQIIDYTWGRESSFFSDAFMPEQHIDFTWPYDSALRQQLLAAAHQAGIELHDGGTYGATQGPRLETAAEVRRLQRDGCDLVGMTGMPEAALARELGLAYACCAVVANRGAGMDQISLSMAQIQQTLAVAMQQVYRLMDQFIDLR